MKTINIGIIGFGQIGSGVVKALISRRAFLKEKSGIDIRIVRICDKDLKARRPVAVSKKLLTNSITRVLYDPQIDVVVELVGGIIPAKDIVLEALRQGKHVVTANKALLSEHGQEIFNLANTLGLCVGFEASVGGGIPIIRALKEGFVANRIDLMYGIINGTSNFILTKMSEDGLSFKDALAIAQKSGYAEHDPRLDISGGDTCHKLSILALLGFGIAVRPKDIYTEGISDLDALDLQHAKDMGCAIKLLAIAKRTGNEAELRVHPTLIPQSHLLANVGGVFNAIFVKGDLVGENLFYGPGAGAAPTSSAVVSDIIAIARCMTAGSAKICPCVPFRRDVARIRKMADIKTKYYIRFSAIDKPGVLAKISGILAKYKISIASVTQKQRKASSVVPIIMMTHEASEREMSRAIAEIDKLAIMKKKSVRVRIEA